MPLPDTNRRLTRDTINQDIDAFDGLSSIADYHTNRPEAQPDVIQAAYDKMVAAQRNETVKQAEARAATDEARAAEWEFHNAIIAAKDVVRGQFGNDSQEVQALGMVKKSQRKRPTTRKKVNKENPNSNAASNAASDAA